MDVLALVLMVLLFLVDTPPREAKALWQTLSAPSSLLRPLTRVTWLFLTMTTWLVLRMESTCRVTTSPAAPGRQSVSFV